MTLLQSWIDSLQLLKPKNLKLFALVTLKSMIDTYKLMFRFFLWIIPVFIVFFLLLSLIGPYTIPNYYGPWEAIKDRNIIWFNVHMKPFINLLFSFMFLAVCFITRPSIEQKNWYYLLRQYKKTVFYWILFLFLVMILHFESEVLFLNKINFYKNYSHHPLFRHLTSLFSTIWYILILLFFADSAGGFKNFCISIWNAIKMIVFNLPLFIIMGTILWIPFLLNTFYYLLRGEVFATYIIMTKYYILLVLLAIILLPFVICPIANIYIKKIHDQFDLYFKRQTPQE